MHHRPEVFHDVVGRQFGMEGDAPPGEENPQMARAQVRRHANQFAREGIFALHALPGPGLLKSLFAATARISMPALSLWPFNFLATLGRPIEGISMGPFAVNFHAVITKAPRGFDQLGEGQCGSAIPHPQISDAVKT